MAFTTVSYPKSSGNTISSADYNQLLEAIQQGTKDIKTGAIDCTAGVVKANASILAKTANYTVALADWGRIIHASNNITITLPTVSGSYNGFQINLLNIGTGTITFSSASTIRSKDSVVTLSDQYAGATIWSDGASWFIVGDLA